MVQEGGSVSVKALESQCDSVPPRQQQSQCGWSRESKVGMDGGKVGETERSQIVGLGDELGFILHVMEALELESNKTIIFKN